MTSEPLWQRVYTSVRQGIQSLEYLPGEPVLEVELAQKLQVSRTPVREALRRLESDGFLSRRHGSTATVAKVSLTTTLAAAAIRCRLEPYAVRLATPHITAAEIAEARAVLTERDRYAATKGNRVLSHRDYLVLERLGQEFHNILDTASREPLLTSIIDEHLWPSWFGASATMTHEWLERSSAEHWGILEAVVARDTEEAEARMREHLEEAFRNLEEVRDLMEKEAERAKRARTQERLLSQPAREPGRATRSKSSGAADTGSGS